MAQHSVRTGISPTCPAIAPVWGRRALPVLFGAVFIASSWMPMGGLSAAQAAETTPRPLAYRVQQLELAVQRIETRLNALDARLGATASAQAGRPKPTSGRDIGTIKENWYTIKDNMDSKRVHSLLGVPTRVLKIGRQTVWYYTYKGFGSGSVVLGVGNRVVGWQAPSFGGW